MTLVHRWKCVQSWLPPHDTSCTAGGVAESFAAVHRASNKHTTEPPEHPTVTESVVTTSPAVPEEER